MRVLKYSDIYKNKKKINRLSIHSVNGIKKEICRKELNKIENDTINSWFSLHRRSNDHSGDSKGPKGLPLEPYKKIIRPLPNARPYYLTSNKTETYTLAYFSPLVYCRDCVAKKVSILYHWMCFFFTIVEKGILSVRPLCKIYC